MSIMFMKIRSVSRGAGGSAVAKAAYISRERIVDERTGKTHDYRKVGGLEHAEIVLPEHAAASAADWARDRAALWNRAESSEPRRNARVAREYTIALPHELSGRERVVLAQQFARSIAERYGAAVDLAVHGPTPRGDPRNHHAHVLATTREVDATGFGAKTSIELSNRTRKERDLPHIAAEFRALRAAWAGLANQQLREAHLDARLEPRSRATLARERADFELRARTEPLADAALQGPARDRPLSIEELQRRAIERWRAYRAAREAGQEPTRDQDRERDRSRDRGHDAGFEL